MATTARKEGDKRRSLSLRLSDLQWLQRQTKKGKEEKELVVAVIGLATASKRKATIKEQFVAVIRKATTMMATEEKQQKKKIFVVVVELAMVTTATK